MLSAETQGQAVGLALVQVCPEGELIAVVVVFVPIALGAPAVFVFIPPAMVLPPASLPSLP